MVVGIVGNSLGDTLSNNSKTFSVGNPWRPPSIPTGIFGSAYISSVYSSAFGTAAQGICNFTTIMQYHVERIVFYE